MTSLRRRRRGISLGISRSQNLAPQKRGELPPPIKPSCSRSWIVATREHAVRNLLEKLPKQWSPEPQSAAFIFRLYSMTYFIVLPLRLLVTGASSPRLMEPVVILLRVISSEQEEVNRSQ